MSNNSNRDNVRAGFTWYPGDWLSAEDLRSVSFAAKGLWIGMICLMARSAKCGKLLDHLQQNADSKWLAKQLGGTPEEVDVLLAELESAKVFSRDNGGIVCRKMWRPTGISEKRADAGRLGALAKQQQIQAIILAKSSNGGYGKDVVVSLTQEDVVVWNDDVPVSLRKDEFAKAWENWILHRREIGHALKPSTARAQWKKLGVVGSAEAVKMIEQSIEQGWQGLFPVKEQSHGTGKQGDRHRADVDPALYPEGTRLSQE